jgi:hypothetical protein
MNTVSSGDFPSQIHCSMVTRQQSPWRPLSTAHVTVMEQSHVTSLVMSARVVLRIKVKGDNYLVI